MNVSWIFSDLVMQGKGMASVDIFEDDESFYFQAAV